MGKFEYFRTGHVKYPAKEEAMAFIDGDNLPLSTVVIGVTYPLADYHITNGAESKVYTMEYVLEGAGELNVGGEWVRAEAGDTYILRGNEVHDYRSDPKRPWKKVWINFTCEYIAALMDAYRIKSGVYAADTCVHFETLLKLSKSGRPYGEICFEIAECIHRIIACVAVASRKRRDSDAFLIREALEAAVYKKCGLDAIADELHISKSTLIRIFRKAYGTSPYEFLLQAKTEASKLLLENTRMSIKEIADRVGIADEHYFSAVFYKRTGVRPGAYRKGKRRVNA